MPKRHDRTIQHLTDDQFLDSPSPSFHPEFLGPKNFLSRLTLSIIDGYQDAWKEIAKRVTQTRGYPVKYFPDTNIVINDNAKDFWNSLRLYHLESGESRAIMSAAVWSELKDWLDSPRRKHELAASIKSSLWARNGWISYFGIEDDDQHAKFFDYYILLTGIRKLMLPLVMDGSIDGSLRDKSQAMSFVQKKFGNRTELLAGKGAKDYERGLPVSLIDECHILLAIYYAITTGVEVLVVTTDEDLVEAFFKAQWFLDTHYKAMLAGKLIKTGAWQGKKERWIDTHRMAFSGEVETYERPSDQFYEVLPKEWNAAVVSIIYIKPDGTGTQFSFVFEQEMIELINIKSRTNGLSSDLFGGKNIHINLNPIPEIAGKIGIGQDIISTSLHPEVRLSVLDLTHSTNCQERHVDVDPGMNKAL